MTTDPDHPFAVLGIAPAFELDEETLRRTFIAASAQSHPDRAVDPEQQAELARRAARINHAYQVLKDPEPRANALLALLGGPDASAEKNLPEGLLEEILAARERMDEAQSSGNRKQIHEWENWVRSRHDHALKKIAKLFRQVQAAPSPDPRILHDIRIQLNGLRYYLRMIEQLEPNDRSDDPSGPAHHP